MLGRKIGSFTQRAFPKENFALPIGKSSLPEKRLRYRKDELQ
jgi:hypothetical protein